jgi:hypothetical protein
VKYLQRIYPLATAGVLESFAYDPASGRFSMEATASRRVAPGQEKEETLVEIPANVAGPVRVTGAALLDRVIRQPDGRRVAAVAPTGGGAYQVAIG